MREKGFTLIELMVILAIIAIAAGIAVPSFNSMLKEHQLRSAADDYYAALGFARAEAVRSGRPVEVVTRKDNKWSEGLIVKHEDASDGTEGESIRIIKGKKGLTVTEENNVVRVMYNGKGYITAFDSADAALVLPEGIKMDFCNGRLQSTARQVRVLVSGFAAVKTRVGC